MIIQKKVSELNDSERKQIAQLLRTYSPNVHEDYILNLTQKDKEYDLVLYKNKQKVLGLNYYKITKGASPFFQKKRPIIYFGHALKDKEFKGNIIWKLGPWYARRNMGYFYPLWQTVGISEIVSPKVYEKFTQLFPTCYPNPEQDNFPVVQSFLSNYFKQYFNTSIEIDDALCFDYPGFEKEDDITEHWERYFKAKDNRINDLFIRKGIIKVRNNHFYTTAKTLAVCGVRNPLPFRKKIEFRSNVFNEVV